MYEFSRTFQYLISINGRNAHPCARSEAGQAGKSVSPVKGVLGASTPEPKIREAKGGTVANCGHRSLS